MNKAVRKWLIVNGIFFIIVIAVLLYLWSRCSSTEEFMQTRGITRLSKFSELKDSLQTGDLIFLSGSTCGMRIINGLISIPFSHIGMIIKDVSGTLYIWEADLGQRTKEGVRMMLLDDKLKYSRCKQIGAIIHLVGKRNFTEEEVKKSLYKNADKGMDKIMYSWVLGGIAKNDNTVFCSELIADTYKDLGIIKTKKPSFEYGPQDFFNHKIDLSAGYGLTEPEYFILPYEKAY